MPTKSPELTFLPQNPWPGLCLLIWPVDQAIENWGGANISFIKDGVRRAGYAIVSNYSIKAAQSLPPNTSAPKAELIALMWALIPREGKIIDIYTDSKYAFILHATLLSGNREDF